MKKTAILAAVGILTLGSNEARADTFGTGGNSFTVDFTTIGNPGNAPDTTGDPNPAGSVGYTYRIGTYEVSRDMVTKANAATPLLIPLADTWRRGCRSYPAGEARTRRSSFPSNPALPPCGCGSAPRPGSGSSCHGSPSRAPIPRDKKRLVMERLPLLAIPARHHDLGAASILRMVLAVPKSDEVAALEQRQ